MKGLLILLFVSNTLYLARCVTKVDLVEEPKDNNATKLEDETYYNATNIAPIVEAKSKGTNHLNRQVLTGLGAAQGLMSTATGVLAAVGGGYLMYALMTTVFENYLDPAFNREYGHLFGPLEVPPLSVQNAQAAAGQSGRPSAGPQQGPFRRNGFSLRLPFLDRIMSSIRSTDYPEATFRYLQVDNFHCRKRVVCEMEQLLSKTGMPKIILQNLSNKIPGMDKYEDAVWWALQKNTCKALQANCPLGLAQTLLKAAGIS